MKKILIAGANSYIGTSFDIWLRQWPDQYKVDTIDMLSADWKDKDFSVYDVVFHVAGIAHVDTKKASAETRKLYYKINRDLTLEVAKKAKKSGVKQFIFMSSIIIYGDSSLIGKKRIITKNTIPTPSNFYADSKLQAEQCILPLQSDQFNVVILRPPMIYGRGSKGNYPKLAYLARKLPVFPDIHNERSMLHIGNLCEFIRMMIDYEEKGIFFPQNKEYVKTSEMVEMMARLYGNKIHLTRKFNSIIKLFGLRSKNICKLFGSLVYDKSMSEYKEEYCVFSFEETLRMTCFRQEMCK
ncbi:MAG TPA: NAD-dependent epimerase/dehydratase family protein [Clostridiales bacterium]|nr:NAD-dependent epimerase/dehydratase family protein [Clostridiales bacterium]